MFSLKNKKNKAKNNEVPKQNSKRSISLKYMMIENLS